MRRKNGSKTPLMTSWSPALWQPLRPPMLAEQNGWTTKFHV